MGMDTPIWRPSPCGQLVRTSRCYALVRVLGSSFSRAEFIAQTETATGGVGVFGPPARAARPGPAKPARPGLRPDLLLSGADGQQDPYLDGSVMSSFRPRPFEGTVRESGYAARLRHEANPGKYNARVRTSVRVTPGTAPSFRPFRVPRFPSSLVRTLAAVSVSCLFALALS